MHSWYSQIKLKEIRFVIKSTKDILTSPFQKLEVTVKFLHVHLSSQLVSILMIFYMVIKIPVQFAGVCHRCLVHFTTFDYVIYHTFWRYLEIFKTYSTSLLLTISQLYALVSSRYSYISLDVTLNPCVNDWFKPHCLVSNTIKIKS